MGTKIVLNMIQRPLRTQALARLGEPEVIPILLDRRVIAGGLYQGEVTRERIKQLGRERPEHDGCGAAVRQGAENQQVIVLLGEERGQSVFGLTVQNVDAHSSGRCNSVGSKVPDGRLLQ